MIVRCSLFVVRKKNLKFGIWDLESGILNFELLTSNLEP